MTHETKFTPGPWRWLPDRNKVRRIFGASDNQVATASVFANFRPVERSKVAHATADANAHLIAAAPELYSLVDLVFQSFGGGRTITFSNEDVEAFRAALVKARGES